MLLDVAGNIDLQNPLNTNSYFAQNLYGCWLTLPNRKAGPTWFDLTAGRNHGSISIVSGYPKWVSAPLPGQFGALYQTGGSGMVLPFPALTANQAVSIVVQHLPLTWTGSFTTL